MRTLLLLMLTLYTRTTISAQGCCSGGSGSPIAGGASQGVLFEQQAEVAVNYLNTNTHRFFKGDQRIDKLFDRMSTNYLYLRFAYGVSKKLTMSVEAGYFLDKTQIGLKSVDTFHASGPGDLILFPRYTVYSKNTEKHRNEVTIGMGYKIPLGACDDSTLIYTNPTTGKKSYTISPPTIQTSSGAHDLIFYGFFFRGYPAIQFRVFANVLYINKGWNKLGQRFGDYASVGLFASKTLYRKIGITLQLKEEITGKMQYDKNVDMLAYYNVDVHSTGNHKLSLVPQISYTRKKLTVYSLTDIPLYQYVNGTQVGSAFQATVGMSYRFYFTEMRG